MAEMVEEARPKTAATQARPLGWEIERRIIALIHAVAAACDERRFLDWAALFCEDGVYSAITNENLAHQGLRLFKDEGRAGLNERAAFQLGMIQTPRGKTLHLVTNIIVSSGKTASQATSTSNFLMMRTADLEHTELLAAGRYLDRFEERGSDWRIKERLVVVDSNMLPPEFTELL
ncbi:MAG: aromatic-ring-hydroxylating dioxygenase subunit beta [Caulobacteraceae bacterium]